MQQRALPIADCRLPIVDYRLTTYKRLIGENPGPSATAGTQPKSAIGNRQSAMLRIGN
jgi:hypothetical protein